MKKPTLKKRVLLPRSRPKKVSPHPGLKRAKAHGAARPKKDQPGLDARRIRLLHAQMRLFIELYKKTEQVRRQGAQLRALDQAENSRLLRETAAGLEAETKRNRFFTLPIVMLAIAGFDGRFVELNPTWKKALGYTEKELFSKPFLQLLPPEDQPNALERLARLQASSGTGAFENRFRCKDGSTKWLGWTVASYAEEQLFYISARDISGRKQAEQQVEELCQESHRHLVELTGINKQLQAFNYSVSHDLRAPLRRIRGLAQAVLEDCGPVLNAGARDYLQRIGTSARYMDAMLCDLLDYSRLSQSQCTLKLLNLEEAVRHVLAQFQIEIRAKHVRVQIQPPFANAWGHLPILNQILSNLVDNALKYTQENTTPHIRIWTEEKGERVRLCVEDNGVGITPANQRRVFGLFVRLQGAEALPGTGVGLALVQKGAERMGGCVGVESKWGKGSRFWLELDSEKKQVVPPPGRRTRRSQHKPGTTQ
jgi:PAS domain S-box-containing protein